MACPITWVPWIMRVMNEAGLPSGGIRDHETNTAMYRLFQDGTPIALAADELRRLVTLERRRPDRGLPTNRSS